MEFDYDIIVIWAGSGWLTVSIWLAWAGKSVALIEKGMIGWDCTNFGCVPSKALIDVTKHNPNISFEDALSETRKRRQVFRDEETPEEIEKYWLKVIEWHARFIDKNTISIDWKKEITGKKIIISTWSKPVVHEIQGLNKEDILTNETIFEVEKKIEKLVVIGGWYIGCELAESFVNIWVDVTLIQRNTRLIPREEVEASEITERIFKEKGMNLECNTLVKEVHYSDWKKYLMVMDRQWTNKRKIAFDKVLIATGRIANAMNLDLEKPWVEFDKNWIKVDNYNRTNIKNIFAIWDVVRNNPKFTHWANNEARGVIRNILVPFYKKCFRWALLPATLYTNIEVSRVWKTREQLLKNYDETEVRSETLYFDQNDRSKVTEDTEGFITIHFKRLTWKILWATVMSTGAWDMTPLLSLAIRNKTSAYKLSRQVFSYPTKSRLVRKVCDKFVIHTLSNFKREFLYFLKEYSLQIITFIIWALIVTLFVVFKKTTGATIEEMSIWLYNFISGNKFWWPFIYMALYAIRPIVLFPATVMTFMSGALFGFLPGLFFTMIWENLSACFAYFLWKVFGKKLVHSDEGTSLIGTLRERANKSPFMAILSARLLFFPFDITNYISGFLGIKFRSFMLATIIGIIPGASVFILAGAAFHNQEITSFKDLTTGIDIRLLYYAAILFVCTIILSKVLKKISKKNSKQWEC